ncbi:DUF2934 domain-containing protein [Enterovirga sp. CN4-39]|uniref:DUF2934 domain-containing protein n=1 Tax=Enterovirga sp. CN4-39 TaxID=3400910 RepID=UPI003C03BABD
MARALVNQLRVDPAPDKFPAQLGEFPNARSLFASPYCPHVASALTVFAATRSKEADVSNQVTKEQIRTRALELWEQSGRPLGKDLGFWLQAERELKAAGASDDSSPDEDTEMRSGAPDPSFS